jgi:hypothetical protein
MYISHAMYIEHGAGAAACAVMFEDASTFDCPEQNKVGHWQALAECVYSNWCGLCSAGVGDELHMLAECPELHI